MPKVEIRSYIATIATFVVARCGVINQSGIKADPIGYSIRVIDVCKGIETHSDTLHMVMPVGKIWIARAEVILQRSTLRTKAKRLSLDAIAATCLRNNSDQVAARYRV